MSKSGDDKNVSSIPSSTFRSYFKVVFKSLGLVLLGGVIVCFFLILNYDCIRPDKLSEHYVNMVAMGRIKPVYTKVFSACEDTVKEDVSRESPPNQVQNQRFESLKEYYKVTVVEPGWKRFSSNMLGMSFEFPITSNYAVSFSYTKWPDQDTDPTGTELIWTQKDTNISEGEVYSELIAKGNSKNFLVGRMDIEPIVYKWSEKNGEYFLHSRIIEGNENYIKVNKIKIYDLDHSQGLLYLTDRNCDEFTQSLGAVCEKNVRKLIVNFPFGHHEDIEAVTFDIPKYFVESDIVYLVESIKFERR